MPESTGFNWICEDFIEYDLSVGNSMEAIRGGCDGLHLTINGMGERAGNTPLSSAVAAIKDFMPNIKINVDEKNLFKASKLISTFSGQTVSSNKPIANPSSVLRGKKATATATMAFSNMSKAGFTTNCRSLTPPS